MGIKIPILVIGAVQGLASQAEQQNYNNFCHWPKEPRQTRVTIAHRFLRGVYCSTHISL